MFIINTLKNKSNSDVCRFCFIRFNFKLECGGGGEGGRSLFIFYN